MAHLAVVFVLVRFLCPVSSLLFSLAGGRSILQEDQRVLAADIKRTRQAYAMFKREEVMQLVSQVLERYCVGHGIRYKQGQNELIAPFVMLKVSIYS